ncbi:TRAP transporter small permease [Tropicimonas sp. S265A]|uniref:TRAP transporter small permease n=1 Tax=Tropicimonas sp. S265A TaxID=3415134 RepID=UPI003C7E9A81
MIAPVAEARLGRALETLARGLAYAGGLVLVAISVLTVLSITGRALISVGLGPIRGDFELVELGCAIAVFLFLPWCQLKRGHVTVDILVDHLPRRGHAGFGLVGDICVLVAATLIAWRLYLGFGEKFPYGSDSLRAALSMGFKPFFPETTYELELPIWIPYGLALIGAVIFVIVSAYTVWRSLNWTLAGQEGRP